MNLQDQLTEGFEKAKNVIKGCDATRANWAVVYDPKTGDPFAIPFGRNPMYYIKKGFLAEKPVIKKVEPEIVEEKVRKSKKED